MGAGYLEPPGDQNGRKLVLLLSLMEAEWRSSLASRAGPKEIRVPRHISGREGRRKGGRGLGVHGPADGGVHEGQCGAVLEGPAQLVGAKRAIWIGGGGLA